MSKQTELKERRAKIIQGLDLSYKRLIEFKKNKDSPIIISQKGKVVELNPNELITETHK